MTATDQLFESLIEKWKMHKVTALIQGGEKSPVIHTFHGNEHAWFIYEKNGPGYLSRYPLEMMWTFVQAYQSSPDLKALAALMRHEKNKMWIAFARDTD